MPRIPKSPKQKKVKNSVNVRSVIGKRGYRALKKAGANRKRGTCPLGKPPVHKHCVRGHWMRKRIPKRRPDSVAVEPLYKQ